MRRSMITLVLLAAIAALSLPAAAANEKLTFSDVALPNGQTGEIEAGVKSMKNKPDSIECSYFTDDYRDSLGYYFGFVEPAPTDPDAVLDFCLANFDERNT